ncbi:MAG: hypothetical protein KatS3mg044_0897 [Rhodothermaceae bacterium]|nr:MAG: hypothetical protein KatS3mg044_0897 [Rhodothermaceae bacterium]
MVFLCTLVGTALYAGPAAAQTWTEVAKKTASDGAVVEWFGWSVSISGDWALVGAPQSDGEQFDSGAAYILAWNGGTWTEVKKLTASDGATGDFFGWSVAIDGNRAIVGAYWDDNANGGNAGAAYVYEWGGSGWVEVQKLTPSDGANSDEFGYSVSIEGDRAIVGARRDDDNGTDSGSAYVFERGAGGWSQVAKLTASDGENNDNFGMAVSISGGRAIVGVHLDDVGGIQDLGSAYVFEQGAGGWSQVAKLTASDGLFSDQFGYSVSLDGDRVIVGAVLGDGLEQNTGTAYVFEWDGSTWSEAAKLMASDGALGDQFGYSVSLDGDRALVGSYLDGDFDQNYGAAYVYTWDGSAWNEEAKLTASDGALGDQFGYSVSLSGDRALIGTWRDDDKGQDAGAVYVFEASPTLPVELASFTAVPDGEAVVLAWRTASETNNAGFEVQHDAAGAWRTLAFVAGQGTTAEGHAYTHRVEGLAPGTHRFRLRQVDFDGRFAYSPEVAVTVDVPGAYVLAAPYPNPFRGATTLRVAVAETQPVRVAVYDVLGREVAVLHAGPMSGGTTHVLRFEAGGLPAGMYVVRAEGARFRASRMVLLMR